MYLLMLAEALGANKLTPFVHITIQLPTKAGDAMLDPMRVTTSGDPDKAFGILMPARV